MKTTTYSWELLDEPAARVDPVHVADEFELVAPDSGPSQESKCISIAISKFPLQASSKDFAIALEAPVTLTNCSTRLADIFVLAAIFNLTTDERGKLIQLGWGEVENCLYKSWL